MEHASSIAVLDIFAKFLEEHLEEHQQQSSYSALIWAFNMLSVINDFSKNTGGGTYLILSDYSLTISRTPFNRLMLGGNIRSYIPKQDFN